MNPAAANMPAVANADANPMALPDFAIFNLPPRGRIAVDGPGLCRTGVLFDDELADGHVVRTAAEGKRRHACLDNMACGVVSKVDLVGIVIEIPLAGANA